MNSTLRRIMVASAVCGGLLPGVGTAAAAGPVQNEDHGTAIGHSASVTAASPTPRSFSVTNVDLKFETCEDRGIAWVCPFTATFTLNRGTGGTVSWDILGNEVSCSGSSSAFDRPQQDVAVPSNADLAWVSSALVFPESEPPALARSPHTSSAIAAVHSPNPVSSAPAPFGGPACPAGPQ